MSSAYKPVESYVEHPKTLAELNEIDTSGVEPLAQVSELFNAAANVLRADVLRPSLDRTVVFSQAPETDGVFFKVPKVIER